MQQLSLDLLDHSRYPYRPYCYDLDPARMVRKSLSEAVKCTNMQVNPAHALYWIVVDIDSPVISDPISPQMAAIFDGDLPTPNFLVVHPTKQTAHAFFALARPVAKASHESMHAMRYAAAIEAALIRGFGSDATYAGLVAKNPFSPAWRRIDLRSEAYTLHELDEALDLVGPSKSELRAEALGLSDAGRNVTVFDQLRFYAYQYVQMFREDSTFEAWQQHLAAKAEVFNVFESQPSMHFMELRHIVKSVARWTWSKYTGQLSDKAFSDLQAFRGAKGGRIAARMLAEKAQIEGTTVSEKMKEVRAKRPTLDKPWNDLGISKAQWYRDRKTQDENKSQP